MRLIFIFIYSKYCACIITYLTHLIHTVNVLYQIESNCSSGLSRWIVLETSHPDETILACCRLQFHNENVHTKYGLVDIIAVMPIENKEIQISLYKQFIFKIENIIRSQGYSLCIVHIPQWRTDIQEIFTHFNYIENGGFQWPVTTAHILIKPTMIMEFMKNFVSHLQHSI